MSKISQQSTYNDTFIRYNWKYGSSVWKSRCWFGWMWMDRQRVESKLPASRQSNAPSTCTQPRYWVIPLLSPFKHTRPPCLRLPALYFVEEKNAINYIRMKRYICCKRCSHCITTYFLLKTKFAQLLLNLSFIVNNENSTLNVVGMHVIKCFDIACGF